MTVQTSEEANTSANFCMLDLRKFQELQEFQKKVSFFKPGESAGTGVRELSL